jgi:hypothetical protein
LMSLMGASVHGPAKPRVLGGATLAYHLVTLMTLAVGCESQATQVAPTESQSIRSPDDGSASRAATAQDVDVLLRVIRSWDREHLTTIRTRAFGDDLEAFVVGDDVVGADACVLPATGLFGDSGLPLIQERARDGRLVLDLRLRAIASAEAGNLGKVRLPARLELICLKHGSKLPEYSQYFSAELTLKRVAKTRLALFTKDKDTGAIGRFTLYSNSALQRTGVWMIEAGPVVGRTVALETRPRNNPDLTEAPAGK